MNLLSTNLQSTDSSLEQPKFSIDLLLTLYRLFSFLSISSTSFHRIHPHQHTYRYFNLLKYGLLIRRETRRRQVMKELGRECRLATLGPIEMPLSLLRYPFQDSFSLPNHLKDSVSLSLSLFLSCVVSFIFSRVNTTTEFFVREERR